MSDSAPGQPEVERLVAPNPGPMTLAGTNTYVVGRDPAWVIDPGPDDAGHLARVRAVADERGGIGGVLLTHGHADHSAGVAALGGELLWGRASGDDEMEALAAGPTESVDDSSPPVGRDSSRTEQVGPFTVIAAPGHAPDHVCFVWDRVCFCGDLVLGEGSSIVPPAAGGGSLAQYMDSLARLDALDVDLLAPGHGPWITDPAARVAEYVAHREDRDRRLRAALARGQRSREALLAEVWDDVPELLRPAAAFAMQAHLEKLAAEGALRGDLGP
jgi:glyoxylase-like metal-dependent hydrolase (beta-lactamase superfamily II)